MSKISLSVMSIVILFTATGCAQIQSTNPESTVIPNTNETVTPVSFATPTPYSTKLINNYSHITVGRYYEWHLADDTGVSTDSGSVMQDNKECKEEGMTNAIFPYFNAHGIHATSLDDSPNLPVQDIERAIEMSGNDFELINLGNTYLINCMVARGYQFQDEAVN